MTAPTDIAQGQLKEARWQRDELSGAIEFLRAVVAEHGDGPMRIHAHRGGSMLLCWEVAGRDWSALVVGDRVRVTAPVAYRPIVTTLDGDRAFEVAVLSATLACKEGVST
jgi:hypothetical protein